LQHEMVREAVVVARKNDSGEQNLCAYVVAEKVIEQQLKEHLKRSLPSYMVPMFFVILDELPLLSNGKINRKALPEPSYHLQQLNYVGPNSNTENKLVHIWEEVLGVESISIQDDFFDLGGHSLKATLLMAKVNKIFQVNISLREIFENPTIQKLAQIISELVPSKLVELTLAEEREYYPVTSTQKRQLILDKMIHEGVYNMPSMLLFKEDIDVKRVESIFRKLLKRHESLRTSFEWIEEEPIQKIEDYNTFVLEYEELHEMKEPQSYVVKQMLEKFIRPFDLTCAPLFRAKFIRLPHGESILLVDMHHIIADGISLNILVQEFIQLYDGQVLSDLKFQYKDYAVWQKDYFDTNEIKQQEEFWLETFSGDLPILNLPTDYSRPQIQSFEGEHIDFKVDKKLTDKLKLLINKSKSTLYTVMLSAYNILLSKYSGQEDIIVGSPVAGRNHVDLEGVMGMFVNTIALRNQPKVSQTFSQFLAQVKENCLNAFDNQHYPLEELLNHLQLPRDLSRNPLFSTMFSLHNKGLNSSKKELSTIQVDPYEIHTNTSKFDLSLTAFEGEEGLTLQWEYCTKLFTASTIKKFANSFVRILDQIVRDESIVISDISIVSKEEQEILL
ncbi:non-ribosomal peptide synthetase, partial [Bacillus anthracis]